MLIGILITLTLLVFVPYSYHRKFGKHPRGERLIRIQKSSNYKNGQFRNLSPTPMFTKGVSWKKMLTETLFLKTKNRKPKSIPFVKNDLHQLDKNENCVIWLGHS